MAGNLTPLLLRDIMNPLRRYDTPKRLRHRRVVTNTFTTNKPRNISRKQIEQTIALSSSRRPNALLLIRFDEEGPNDISLYR